MTQKTANNPDNQLSYFQVCDAIAAICWTKTKEIAEEVLNDGLEDRSVIFNEIQQQELFVTKKPGRV